MGARRLCDGQNVSMEEKDTRAYSRRLMIGALLASAVYVGILVWLGWGSWCQLRSKELNEVGDFLAGAFSPLAFFWLVVGYFQQGHELNQNTKALRLQHDELKESVAQAKQMVQINREELDALKEDRTKADAATDLATWVGLTYVRNREGGESTNGVQIRRAITVEFVNYGSDALEIYAQYTGGNARLPDSNLGFVRHGESLKVTAVHDGSAPDSFETETFVEFELTYRDRLGRRYKTPVSVIIRKMGLLGVPKVEVELARTSVELTSPTFTVLQTPPV